MVIGTRHELLKKIGESIRASRLLQNVSQKNLAARSGVSLNAVRHLEDGEGATLATFILVCRSLGKDAWIDSLAPETDFSPIAFAEALEKHATKTRRRASPGKGTRK